MISITQWNVKMTRTIFQWSSASETDRANNCLRRMLFCDVETTFACFSYFRAINFDYRCCVHRFFTPSSITRIFLVRRHMCVPTEMEWGVEWFIRSLSLLMATATTMLEEYLWRSPMLQRTSLQQLLAEIRRLCKSEIWINYSYLS